MFRITPNGCSRRNMQRFCRDGPCLRKIRGEPHLLRLMNMEQRFVEFEEIEKLLFNYTQKEIKS